MDFDTEKLFCEDFLKVCMDVRPVKLLKYGLTSDQSKNPLDKSTMQYMVQHW